MRYNIIATCLGMGMTTILTQTSMFSSVRNSLLLTTLLSCKINGKTKNPLVNGQVKDVQIKLATEVKSKKTFQQTCMYTTN